MQISHETFKNKPLRAHGLLADVPLHDVWAFRLTSTHTPQTLMAFRNLWRTENAVPNSPIVRSLFWLRGVLGRLFRWDEASHQPESPSYLSRLTEADHAKSLETPGRPSGGPFRVLYAFEHEALDEIINATVHAFSVMAMEQAPHGYTVYWAIYVKPVSALTPIYMTLIDPFRRLFVYPALIKRLEAAWTAAYQDRP